MSQQKDPKPVGYRLLSIRFPPSGRVLAVLERKDESDPMPFVTPISLGAAALISSSNKEAIAKRRFVLAFLEDNAWYVTDELLTEDELTLFVDLLPKDSPLKIKRQQIVDLEILPDAIRKEKEKHELSRSV
jgi:hypothetical protein